MRGKPLTILETMMLGVGMLWAQSPRTIHGFVSDAHCGAAHSSPSVAATICMQKCMKGGSPAVIVSGGKVYQLKGDTAAVAAYVGQYVTVQGRVDGDTITVVSVSKLPYVQYAHVRRVLGLMRSVSAIVPRDLMLKLTARQASTATSFRSKNLTNSLPKWSESNLKSTGSNIGPTVRMMTSRFNW
jgi:hypothetical protein